MKISTVYTVFFQVLALQVLAERADATRFLCEPEQVYALSVQGLYVPEQEVISLRTVDREFIFDTSTGVKQEVQNDKEPLKYRILNSENLLPSPVVAIYGELNPTILRIQSLNFGNVDTWVFYLFGGRMNVFGLCAILE